LKRWISEATSCTRGWNRNMKSNMGRWNNK